MYVLAAMLIEEYHTHNKERLAKERGEQDTDTSIALNELLEGDKNLSLEDSRMIDRTWTAAFSVSFHDARSTPAIR
ncbi:hypothetical protein KIN20_021465, partial [Parelaphostrongylus tenuis]